MEAQCNDDSNKLSENTFLSLGTKMLLKSYGEVILQIFKTVEKVETDSRLRKIY